MIDTFLLEEMPITTSFGTYVHAPNRDFRFSITKGPSETFKITPTVRNLNALSKSEGLIGEEILAKKPKDFNEVLYDMIIHSGDAKIGVWIENWNTYHPTYPSLITLCYSSSTHDIVRDKVDYAFIHVGPFEIIEATNGLKVSKVVNKGPAIEGDDYTPVWDILAVRIPEEGDSFTLTMKYGVDRTPYILDREISFKFDRKAAQTFKITPKSINFGENGGSDYNTKIETTYTYYTNTTPADWVTDLYYPPNSSGYMKVAVEPNPSVEPRSTKIEFKNGSTLLDTFSITQSGKQLYFEVDPKSIHAPKEGGDYTVMVKTNMQYKMKVEESTTDFGTTWFTIAQANAVKEIPYLVTVKPNLSSRNFSGRIVFIPTGKSPVIVNITQDGSAPYIVYEPRSTEIDKDTHTWEVIRRHNLPSIIERENLVGLTYTKEEISPYPNAITKYTITASENTSSADRSSYLETSSELYSGGNVNIEGGNTDTIMARYNVVQRSSVVFDVVDSSYSPIRYMTVPAKGNNYRVYVKHNVYWSDTIDNPSWITGPNNTIVPEPGTHYYELGFGVATNEGDARDGTITFNSPRGGTIVLHIHQEAGLVPLIKVSPESITVDSNEHKVMLNVYASHPWSLVHVQAARFILPDWLDLDIVKGGAGVTTITVSIKQALLVDRAELLTFKLDDYEAYDNATIIQRGIENGYDITDVQDDSDWSKRKEAKIRDKYLKVKIRYTGNELAIITALKTLYETSFA